QVVGNLANRGLGQPVERLAPLPGKDPVPEIQRGQFRHEREKFHAAALTPLPSELVRPDRVKECPVQMEASVRAVHPLGGQKLAKIGGAIAAEVEILRVPVAEESVMQEHYIYSLTSARRGSV